MDDETNEKERCPACGDVLGVRSITGHYVMCRLCNTDENRKHAIEIINRKHRIRLLNLLDTTPKL